MVRVVVGRGRYTRQVKVPFWAFALAGGAVVLTGFLMLAFIASLVIFVIPACLIGAGAAHWLRRQANAKREPIFTRNRPNDPNVIEGEYRVHDERRR
jgi:Flp pilus assembly protein TadB